MNARRTLVRKLIYLAILAVLLFPLSMLSKPATTEDPGGVLARRRAEYGLSQASLGEIDPASESMKLATFGMRGVAATLLWSRANDYDKKKDWTNLRVTLEQITKLQPNFVGVWRAQAHNLSYNISRELDDYRDRYYWVKEGVKFLEGGIKLNQREPILAWDVGWFTGHKIGRSDEALQFRRLFADPDDDLYDFLYQSPALPAELRDPRQRRDNWLMGKAYFLRGEQMVDVGGARLSGMSPIIFHSDPPKWQMNYADALEKEGQFGEAVRQEWVRAEREWNDFGSREFLLGAGLAIRFNDMERYQQAYLADLAAFDELTPGLRETVQQEREQTLTDSQRRALGIPLEERSAEEQELAAEASRLLVVTAEDLLARLEADRQAEGRRLAASAEDNLRMATIIARQRPMINFDYWRLRTQVEQSDDALAARELFYQAAQEDLDLERARDLYEQGFQKWKSVLDEFPEMYYDRITGADVAAAVSRYLEMLRQLDEELPEDFVLRDYWEIRQND